MCNRPMRIQYSTLERAVRSISIPPSIPCIFSVAPLTTMTRKILSLSLSRQSTYTVRTYIVSRYVVSSR